MEKKLSMYLQKSIGVVLIITLSIGPIALGHASSDHLRPHAAVDGYGPQLVKKLMSIKDGGVDLSLLKSIPLDRGLLAKSIDFWRELKAYEADTSIVNPRDGVGIGYLYSIIGQTAKTIDDMRQYVDQAVTEDGISTVIYSGEGGQILGNRAVVETLGSRRGVKFYWANNLESRSGLKQELRGKGKQVLFIASSKSGGTDETAFNTQSILRYLIREFAGAQRDEQGGFVSDSLIGKLQGADITAASWKLVLTPAEETVMREVWKHLLFTTTEKTSKSALFRLVTKEYTVDGEDSVKRFNIKTYNIPTAVGGRFSVLSESGNITSLFAGADVKVMNDIVKALEPVYANNDPRINPALEAAILLNTTIEQNQGAPKILMGISNTGKLNSVLEWMGQLVMESLGKEKIGPYFTTASGKDAIAELKKHDGLEVIYFVVNVAENDAAGKPRLPLITKTELNGKQALLYTMPRLDEASLAQFFIFCEEMIMRYGLLNVARQKTITSIHDQRYVAFDPQDQLAVAGAKKAAKTNTVVLQKFDEQQRAEVVAEEIRTVPTMDSDPRLVLGRLSSEQQSASETVLRKAVRKTGLRAAVPDQELDEVLNNIERAWTRRLSVQDPVQVNAIDRELAGYFERIKDVGHGMQEGEVEELARIGAQLLYVSDAYYNKELATAFMYRTGLQTDIIGEWWKMIGRQADRGMLYDYMMGTRDQHSRQQGLIDGPDLAITFFVKFIDQVNDVFGAEEQDEKIVVNGMVGEHMNGLYPKEMLNAYYDGISTAFAEKKRDMAKFKFAERGNLAQVYRVFGRMNELYREMLSFDLQPINVVSKQASLDIGGKSVIPQMVLGQNIHELYHEEELRIIRENDLFARQRFVHAGFPVRHSHTNADGDDGRMTPSELVDHAIENGVTVLYVTGHNSMAGWREAKKYYEENLMDRYILEFRPGVEIDAPLLDHAGRPVFIHWRIIGPDDEAVIAQMQKITEELDEKLERSLQRRFELGLRLADRQVFDSLVTSDVVRRLAATEGGASYLEHYGMKPQDTKLIQDHLFLLIGQYKAFLDKNGRSAYMKRFLNTLNVIGGWTENIKEWGKENAPFNRRALRVLAGIVYADEFREADLNGPIFAQEALRRYADIGCYNIIAHPGLEIFKDNLMPLEDFEPQIVDMVRQGILHGAGKGWIRQRDAVDAFIQRVKTAVPDALFYADGSNPDFHSVRKGSILRGDYEGTDEQGVKLYVQDGEEFDRDGYFRDGELLVKRAVDVGGNSIDRGDILGVSAATFDKMSAGFDKVIAASID